MESKENSQLKMFQKIHWISLLIGALCIVLPLVFWNRIPEQIPMHYNAAGEVDNWEDKTSLILLFFVIAMLMGVMSIVVYFVKANMLSKYSKEQEKSEMQVVYPMIILMNLFLQLMFAYITFCSVTARKLGTLFLPITIVSVFAPLIYMIYKCIRIQATSESRKAVYREIEKNESGVIYRTAVD